MIMNKALDKAKRNDEEKVGLNIKIPIGLKNEFDELCKKNGVSMTSMMLSLIEVVIDESKGNVDLRETELNRFLNERLVDLEKSIKEFEKDPNPDYMEDYKKNQTDRNKLRQLLK